MLTDEPYDRPPTTPSRHADELAPDRVDLAAALALAGVRTGATVLDVTARGWFARAAGAAAGPGGLVMAGQNLAELGEIPPITHAFLPAGAAVEWLSALRPRLAPLARVIVEGHIWGREPTLVARHGDSFPPRREPAPNSAALCAELVAAASAAGFTTTHLEVQHGRLVAVLRATTTGWSPS
jgi:hypothetical protein